jgi:hypothetical protein
VWSLVTSYNILKSRPRVLALLVFSLTAIAKTLRFLAFNQQKTCLVNVLTPNGCDELSLYLGKIWVSSLRACSIEHWQKRAARVRASFQLVPARARQTDSLLSHIPVVPALQGRAL